MPHCGATFDENTVPPWIRVDFKGVWSGFSAAFSNPSRQPPEGFTTAVVLMTAVMFTTAVVSPSFPLW